MATRRAWTLAIVLIAFGHAAPAFAQVESSAKGLIDHHMHPRRQALPEATLAECRSRGIEPCPAPAGFDETGLIATMDSAGVVMAVVLSRAFAATLRAPDDTSRVDDAAIAAQVRATNEWVARAVAAHPGRMIGFLGIDPLHDSAIPEIRYWGRRGDLAGVKMQLSAAGLDFSDSTHVAKLRDVFRAAHEEGLALLVHLRAFEEFGAGEATVFIERVLPAAPGTPVQIAHLAGWGSGYDSATAEALGVFVERIVNDDPRTRAIQFDLSAGVQRNTTTEQGAHLAAAMRRAGIERFLFASDFPGFTPAEMWRLVRETIPLTAEEFERLRSNRAFYLR